ncbi:hypothetical protein [Arcicella rosea]|uniref:Uncharacterized protein n=1 Tax=Arcicella rosea TaxID=502909 RepID=A0A841EIZ1_9BACT|nr:hypothetical protein [Arcicella rosea]MBB6003452.1 hypothetical protein [Arcicella rosea]
MQSPVKYQSKHSEHHSIAKMMLKNRLACCQVATFSSMSGNVAFDIRQKKQGYLNILK